MRNYSVALSQIVRGRVREALQEESVGRFTLFKFVAEGSDQVFEDRVALSRPKRNQLYRRFCKGLGKRSLHRQRIDAQHYRLKAPIPPESGLRFCSTQKYSSRSN